MKKVLSERSKKIVENVIDKIKSGEMSVSEGYNKFVSNMFGGNAYVYYIDRVKELNMISVNERGLFSVNDRSVWKED